MEINYDKAAVGDDVTSFPAFAAGLYQCKLIEAEHKPDNEWKGEPKPCYSLKMQPLKNAIGNKPMMNTDDKEHENFYTDKETQHDKPRFFYFTVSLPYSLHEKSNFGKLVRAIFGDKKPTYTFMEHFVGDTVLCNVDVITKDDGRKVNKITTVMNDPENEIKTTKELSEIPTNDLDKAMKEDVPFDEIPATEEK